jgi:6-phosphogluconolactonase
MNIRRLPHAKAVFVHASLDELGSEVALRVTGLAARAIAAHGIFRVALAGGETPRRCYERLRHLAVDWMHVQVYFGDERCLPRGDAGRNDSMAYDALLKHVPIPPGNVHAIPAELGARDAAAAYAEVLVNGGPLDLVLLGMGEDGHTASLFPDNPALESTANVVPVFNAPKPPAERVSLGVNALNAARDRIFLVAGAGKRNALERLARGASLPVSRIASAEWHLDRAAWPGDTA